MITVADKGTLSKSYASVPYRDFQSHMISKLSYGSVIVAWCRLPREGFLNNQDKYR